MWLDSRLFQICVERVFQEMVRNICKVSVGIWSQEPIDPALLYRRLAGHWTTFRKKAIHKLLWGSKFHCVWSFWLRRVDHWQFETALVFDLSVFRKHIELSWEFFEKTRLGTLVETRFGSFFHYKPVYFINFSSISNRLIL